MHFPSNILRTFFVVCIAATLAACGVQEKESAPAEYASAQTRAVLKSEQVAMPDDDTDFEQARRG